MTSICDLQPEKCKELSEVADRLMISLVDYRNNPLKSDVSPDKLFELYGKVANELNGQKHYFDELLINAALQAGLEPKLAERVPEFFETSYRNLIESDIGQRIEVRTGSGRNVVGDSSQADTPQSYQKFLRTHTRAFQAKDFEPEETGIKGEGLFAPTNDTQIDEAIGWYFDKIDSKPKNKSRMARFEDSVPSKPYKSLVEVFLEM